MTTVLPESIASAPDLRSPYEPDESEGAISVVRRGMAASPALRRGLWVTASMGISVAIGRLVIPILIQRAIDEGGLADPSQLDVGAVTRQALLAIVFVLAAGVASWLTQRRLVHRAEETIYYLRTEAFAKVHQLSVADHNETRKGILLARVTADVEALALFVNWGFFAWVTEPVLVVGFFGLLAFYSWQLTLIVVLCFLPALPLIRIVQRRQLNANDDHRTAVGAMLSTFSEAVTGAAVIRAYGSQPRMAEQLNESIATRYRTKIRTHRYTAQTFVVTDLLAVIAFSAVLVLGIRFRTALDLDVGELAASLFVITLISSPIARLGESLDQTQGAVSAWRKILHLIDSESDVVEPLPGQTTSRGPVQVDVEHLGFSYRVGPAVLRDVSVQIPAGQSVAIVGETGSGKTTFAKLLCRLADPQTGSIRLNGVELRELSPESRLQTVRMVPQDGFLFDATIAENIRFGRPGATDADIRAAVQLLDLGWWVAKLARGLDAEAGERGGNLSVGERQLVALIRAALADPGLLILDEATSAVDPETDAALTAAIRRLSQGRTLISIAHRLATAESADTVMVFDAGQLVQMGPHAELVTQPGVYQGLHEAWIGATR